MKKKVIGRCLLGAPLGVAISFLITVIISITVGDGNYYPVVPELISDFGNEINAVCIQTLCSLLYGAAFAGASVIWEIEHWSLFKMTAAHLLICSAATFPIAYFMRWMPHNLIGVVIYFFIFLVIYLVIWITQYSAIKKRIKQMNKKIRDSNS